MRALSLLPLLLTACPGPTDTADPGELVELWGTVTDPYLHGAPVDGAWVLLDLGDEQIGLRTGSDGGFSMPGLPPRRPVSVTVAMQDYMAVTYSGLRLGELTMPLELLTHARDLGSYATETMTIQGTVSGAPVGSYVFFFGPTDQRLDTSYLDYIQIGSEEPERFEIEVQLVLPEDDYALGALAFDGTDWTVQAASAESVTWGGSAELDFTLDPGALQSLAVSAAPPMLDGTPVSGFPEEYCSSVAVTHLGESMSTTTGYNRGCSHDAQSFGFDVGWTPVAGWSDRLQLYLFDDLATGTYAFGSLPIPDGATELEVALLDSPLLDHHEDLGQGGSVGWQPVEGATGDMLYAYDEDGSLAWYIYPPTGEASFTFPSFPPEFDDATILETGSWAVLSRTVVYAADGSLDQSEAYLGSITQGGQLSL